MVEGPASAKAPGREYSWPIRGAAGYRSEGRVAGLDHGNPWAQSSLTVHSRCSGQSLEGFKQSDRIRFMV